jgi:hypothetical protein
MVSPLVGRIAERPMEGLSGAVAARRARRDDGVVPIVPPQRRRPMSMSYRSLAPSTL